MNNFFYDFMLAIVSAIVGALFGFIIPKLLKKNEEQTVNIIDKQLVFKQIHVEQNQYVYREAPKRREKNRKTSSSNSGGEVFIIYVLGSLFLIYGYLKFEMEISRILIVLTVLLESAFITASINIMKKHCVDIKIKAILLFNIIATVGVPVLVYLMQYPIQGLLIDKKAVLDMIEQDGLISLLGNSDTYGFLLYQSIGVILIFGYILFVMLGTLHILSMANLALNSRLKKMWVWLYKRTIKFYNSCGWYIFFGIILLVISFLLVSGMLVALINNIGA